MIPIINGKKKTNNNLIFVICNRFGSPQSNKRKIINKRRKRNKRPSLIIRFYVSDTNCGYFYHPPELIHKLD